jgi:hypothetical protein
VTVLGYLLSYSNHHHFACLAYLRGDTVDLGICALQQHHRS